MTYGADGRWGGQPLSCAEAAPLLERYNMGETITPTERKAVERHLACCSSCMDTRIFCRSGALAALAPQITETDLAKTIYAALDAGEKRASFGRRLRLFTAGAAAAVAAIVGAFVMVSIYSDTRDASPETAGCAATEPVEVSKGVFLNRCVGRPVKTVVGAAGDVHVTLESGAVGVSVDPKRPNKNRVTVHTRFGTATVKGTVFTVNAEDDGVEVEVFRGTVEIHPEASDSSIFVTRNGGVRLEANGRYQLQEAGKSPIWAKLDAYLKRASLEESPPAGEPPSVVSEARSSDEGAGAEPTTVSETSGPETLGGRANLEASSAKRRGIPSLDRLLMDARTCLLDEDWLCAAARYKQVVRHYGNRWDAMSALISLAKLELRHLGKPRQALSHFRAYVRRYPGGPLLEDAVFGTAECHRRLGHPDKELNTLRSYVEKHPANASTAKMKKRIRELEGR